MAKIQAVWAIDIGQAALKAIKLVPGEAPDRVVAEAFDFVEYPKILSQPDADPEELVREAMATFLERNDLKGSRVAISVSGQAGLVKFIKLPPVEKKRIPDIVKFEARQQIPFALEEVIWDYQQIGGDDADGEEDEGFSMAEVGLFAMKRDQIHRAIQPFKNANIEVDLVQMGPIALYNCAAFDRAPSAEPEKPAEGDAADGDAVGDKPRPKAKAEDQGSVVLLDIGADNTDLIITDGVRIWQRNVPIGGNHFTRALTKELKLTFAKAEHLKRNATKAPDPRAVFTAMRGVFNDFSSEVSRSIGFYSSVNRTAKIAKIVGLGNGFKLPGLQKFLQQNLNYEVERLEGFDKLSGEEVISAPQFQENLMSFAVAYGLAIQGLGKGSLRTNLLPPEIEQVRMIRRKKPWALVAAALLMLGFSAAFFGDFTAWAKATNPTLKQAVADAKTTSQTGDQFKTAFATAKTSFEAKKTEGQNLVGEAVETTNWPLFLKTVSETLPDPAKELGRDPNDPANVPILSKLRVHVDAIVPVYRSDLAVGWYDELPDHAKASMSPLDRKKGTPEGDGWVVQLVGHHYNPPRLGSSNLTDQEKAIAKGPVPFLQELVLPRFWAPRLRMFGISHAALTWIQVDRTWTSEKGASGPLVPPFPALARASAPEGGGGDAGGGGDMMKMMMGSQGGMGGEGMSSGGMSSGGMPSGGSMAMMMGRGGMGMGSGSYEGMMSGMMGPMGGAQSKDPKVKPNYLTRTDFKIEFVWKPVPPDQQPQTEEEVKAKLEEIAKEMQEARAEQKGAIQALDETAIAEASKQILQKAFAEEAALINKRAAALQGNAGAAGGPTSAQPAGGEGGATAPAAGAAPAGAGAAPAGGSPAVAAPAGGNAATPPAAQPK